MPTPTPVKFSDFSTAGALTGAEYIVGLQGGANAKVVLTAIMVAGGTAGQVYAKASATAYAGQWITAFGYGTAAARAAAAAANTGVAYYATDTFQWSRSNGTTWDDLYPAAVRNDSTSISSNSNYTVDFSLAQQQYIIIHCTAALTLSILASNITAGRHASIMIVNSSGGTVTISWASLAATPVGSALPTSVAAGKVHVLGMSTHNTTAASVIVANSPPL